MLAHWCAAHWAQKFSLFSCLKLVQNEMVVLVGEEDRKVKSDCDVWKWELEGKRSEKLEEKGLCWQTEVLVYKMEQETC